MSADNEYLKHIPAIAAHDAKEVARKDEEYGQSWKQRGGVGAYHVAIRKIDRLETQVERFGWDVFKAIESTKTDKESIIETIRDARGYFLLWEAECIQRGFLKPPLGECTPAGRLEIREHVSGFVATYQAPRDSYVSEGWPANDVSGALMNLALFMRGDTKP